MPNLNGKKYAYTKDGMRRYKQDKEKSQSKKGLSEKQKKIAGQAGDKNKIDASDMKKLREKKNAMSEKNAKKQATKKVRSARKYLKKKDVA